MQPWQIGSLCPFTRNDGTLTGLKVNIRLQVKQAPVANAYPIILSPLDAMHQ
jgi:hypothetical protein